MDSIQTSVVTQNYESWCSLLDLIMKNIWTATINGQLLSLFSEQNVLSSVLRTRLTRMILFLAMIKAHPELFTISCLSHQQWLSYFQNVNWFRLALAICARSESAMFVFIYKNIVMQAAVWISIEAEEQQGNLRPKDIIYCSSITTSTTRGLSR